MTKALIYSRVSTQAQKDDGTSLVSQTEACTAYATQNGFTIIRTLNEVYSGAYFHDRPLLNEMRDGIRRGLYDVIVFYAIDRLSRNVAHLAILADECERYNVSLHCVSEDFDTSGEGVLLRSVRAYTAEIEREKIRERTLRGRRTKAENGHLICGMSPYGYSFNQDTKHREIVEDEADVVRDIYHRFLHGESSYAIQNAFNDLGVLPPSRKAGYWHHTAIVRILTNPIYYGASHAFRYQKITQTVRGKRVSSSTVRDRTEWITLPDDITPAIVTPATFDAVQRVMASNRKTLRRGNPSDYLMRQRIVCGVCDRVMRGESVGTNWKAYRCVPHVPSLKCGNSSLKASLVESAVWDRIVEIIRQPEVVRDIVETAQGKDYTKVELLRELKRQTSRVAKADAEVKSLSSRAGTVDDETWDVLRETLTTKVRALKELKERRDELQAELDAHAETEFDLTELDTYIKSTASRLDRMTTDERALVVASLDVRATWTHGKLNLSMTVSPLYSRNRLIQVSNNSKRVEI